MFRNNCYATVWKVEEKDGKVTCQIQTSRKNKETDQYETDFSGFVRFSGDAGEKAKSLNEKDRIKILNCAVSNRYDKENSKTYNYFYVFEFEDAVSRNKEDVKQDAPQQSDDLPF